MRATLVLAAIALASAASGPAGAEPRYAWPAAQAGAGGDTLAARIAAPAGFERRPAPPHSFAAWLRGLPLKPAGAPVLLFDGAPKPRQDLHAAVVDIDVGTRDLQQCADAAMRLRAEWLFASGRVKEIAFNDTGSARPIAFSRWMAGERPHLAGRTLAWSRRAAPDAGYASFRRYMDTVYAWAGTYSLEREMRPVPVTRIEAGDLFIKGGFPGHAVMVADIAENPGTGERRFLLVQSFMPAQEIHVLRNPQAADGAPWYPLAFGDQLITPEWTFPRDSLRRWRTP